MIIVQSKANIRHELAARLQYLPAEQVKLAVIKWLGEDEGDLEALGQELELEQEQISPQLFNDTLKSRSDSTSLTKQPELSPTQKARAFRDWAESHRRGLPLLSDEAISRESIYSNEQL
jgi:hypothetical protein